MPGPVHTRTGPFHAYPAVRYPRTVAVSITAIAPVTLLLLHTVPAPPTSLLQLPNVWEPGMLAQEIPDGNAQVRSKVIVSSVEQVLKRKTNWSDVWSVQRRKHGKWCVTLFLICNI